MRRAIAVLVLAGCSFPGQSAPDASDGPPRVDANGDAGIDALSQPGSCAADDDPTLRLCLDFEERDLVTAFDGSGAGNHAALTSVTYVDRMIPGGDLTAAAHCDGDCEIRIDEAASLDVGAPLTFALWVNADQPPGSRRGLLDNNTQYALFYQASGTVTCSVFPNGGTPTTVTSAPLVAGLWNHVACVAAGGTLTIYNNAIPTASASFSFTLSTNNMRGTLIGENLNGNGSGDETFDGSLDDVRIWARALTEQELCEQADFTSC